MKKPDPVDVYVGSRIRIRRTLLGLSQEKLGNGLGITFQQVQKYERGANRVGASRLFKLSEILECPVSFFFEGYVMGQVEQAANDARITRRESLELIRAYYDLPKKLRKRVFELVKTMKALNDQDTQ